MKRGFLVLAVLVAVIALAYGVSHWYVIRSRPAVTAASTDPLAWMVEELDLDAAAFSKVKSLHDAYQPTCAAMCMEIAKANSRVHELLQKSRSMTPELADAIRAAQLRQADCRTAMLRHIYETAAVLPSNAAERYLNIVTARLLEEGRCLTDVTERKP
jgi:outer membrane murein-binding lipoprotein Lpp